MDILVRGNVYEFSTTFADEAGAPVTPASVTLNISVANGIGNPTVALPMAVVSDIWTATWDTTDIPAGLVFWAVRAVSPHAADQGYFALDANLANAPL